MENLKKFGISVLAVVVGVSIVVPMYDKFVKPLFKKDEAPAPAPAEVPAE